MPWHHPQFEHSQLYAICHWFQFGTGFAQQQNWRGGVNIERRWRLSVSSQMLFCPKRRVLLVVEMAGILFRLQNKFEEKRATGSSSSETDAMLSRLSRSRSCGSEAFTKWQLISNVLGLSLVLLLRTVTWQTLWPNSWRHFRISANCRLVTLESFSGLGMVGIVENGSSGRSRGGTRGGRASPYLGLKKRNDRKEKDSRGSKSRPGPLFSSKSGSAIG